MDLTHSSCRSVLTALTPLTALPVSAREASRNPLPFSDRLGDRSTRRHEGRRDRGPGRASAARSAEAAMQHRTRVIELASESGFAGERLLETCDRRAWWSSGIERAERSEPP